PFLPYFFALVGTQTEAKPPSKSKASAAAAAAPAPAPAPAGAADTSDSALFKIIESEGPIGAKSLKAKFAKQSGLSEKELGPPLTRLAASLGVAAVDRDDEEGAIHDTFEPFRPAAGREGKKLARLEAAMRVLGRYFETVVAAEEAHVERVFSGIFSKVELPDL